MRINKAIKISFHGRHKGKAKFIVAYDGSQPSFSLSLSLSLDRNQIARVQRRFIRLALALKFMNKLPSRAINHRARIRVRLFEKSRAPPRVLIYGPIPYHS